MTQRGRALMEQKVNHAEIQPPRNNQSHFIGTYNNDKNVSLFITLAKYTHSTTDIVRIMDKVSCTCSYESNKTDYCLA